MHFYACFRIKIWGEVIPMDKKALRSLLPGLAGGAACLLLTLVFVLPNASAIGGFCRRAAGLCAGAPDENVSLLGAAAVAENTGEPPAVKKGSAVSPLEEEAPGTAAAENGTGAWETPRDIVENRVSYLAAHEGAAPAGRIYESFFTTGGATDTLGRVSVKNATETKKPDYAALLLEGPSLGEFSPDEPLVLVYHTHTSEAYLPADNGVFYADYATRSADPAFSVVRVGDEICAALEAAGIHCIHDTAVYDGTYNGAYARSRAAVLSVLEKHPSVQIVLDVHRDAIYDSDTLACKPTAVIGGRKAAQIMIITGAEEGPVTDFPRWEENLHFALALQDAAQQKYEGLMKPVFFCRRKYNMDVTPCALLLEVGSDTNTLEEAVYSGRLLGEALGELILRETNETETP